MKNRFLLREYLQNGEPIDKFITLSDFLNNKEYRQIFENAFASWLCEVEEKLPISIIANTEEQTVKNCKTYFMRNFIRNFNYYGYTGVCGHSVGADNKQKCIIKQFTSTGYKEVELPYIHIIT